MPTLISIVSPCFNEEENVDELYRRVIAATSKLDNYQFEFIFIDNASTDGTVAKLKKLASEDRRVKIIVNTRNFGHIRSPYSESCSRAAQPPFTSRPTCRIPRTHPGIRACLARGI